MFSKVAAETLPPHRAGINFRVELIEGATLPKAGGIYGLKHEHLLLQKEMIDEELRKGFIRKYKGPHAASMFGVPKKDASVRWVTDYKPINAITVKNQYPLPNINHLLLQLQRGKIFSKIDLRGAYNLVRVAEGHEWATAFRTKWGMFKWLVMPFGLSNAPACFQQFVNNIFWDMIDCRVLVYLDNILVYLQTQEEHDALVLRVLTHLRANKLYGKISKCEFDCAKVEFLGYVVSNRGLAMDQKKVKTILEWPIPKSVKEVESFLGFANFYRRFVLHYSRRVGNLTKLTHKDARFLPFAWNAAAQSDFDALKAAMSTAPMLAHFVPGRRTVLETDASEYALGAIVSQFDKEGVLHPCGFASRKMLPAKNNYPIHDKELLGIVWALHKWHSIFLSVHGAFDVVTDHDALKHFMISNCSLGARRAGRSFWQILTSPCSTARGALAPNPTRSRAGSTCT